MKTIHEKSTSPYFRWVAPTLKLSGIAVVVGLGAALVAVLQWSELPSNDAAALDLWVGHWLVLWGALGISLLALIMPVLDWLHGKIKFDWQEANFNWMMANDPYFRSEIIAIAARDPQIDDSLASAIGQAEVESADIQGRLSNSLGLAEGSSKAAHAKLVVASAGAFRSYVPYV